MVLGLLSIELIHAQDLKSTLDNGWYKISPEMRLNVRHKNLEFRYRPIDYTYPFANWRMDFMAGIVKGPFKVFLYLKGDKALDQDRQRSWAGIRLDFNQLAIKNKLVLNFQYRYFAALNEQTLAQQYVVQFMDYRLSDHFSTGYLGFGRKDKGRDPIYFGGPLIKFWWSKKHQTLIAFTRDFFSENQYLGFVRQNIVFEWKDKSKQL